MQQPECELIMRQKHIYCIGMAKRKVDSSSRLFAVTLIPRTCKSALTPEPSYHQNLAPWLKKNHQNSTTLCPRVELKSNVVSVFLRAHCRYTIYYFVLNDLLIVSRSMQVLIVQTKSFFRHPTNLD